MRAAEPSRRAALLAGYLLVGAGAALLAGDDRTPAAAPIVHTAPTLKENAVKSTPFSLSQASVAAAPPPPVDREPPRGSAPRTTRVATPRPAPVVIAPPLVQPPSIAPPPAISEPIRVPLIPAPRPESGPTAESAVAASVVRAPVPIGDIDAAGAPLPRPADIAQIADAAPPSAYVPQLTLPGRGAMASGPAGIAFVADAAQLPAPPVLSREQRAALLTDAPTELTLVVDGRRIGEVEIRMAAENRVEIQLTSLLAILSDRFDSAEYAALRGAAAADAFIGFDQLRSAGIELRYDPVYDEISLAA